jgi:hypothetical protein
MEHCSDVLISELANVLIDDSISMCKCIDALSAYNIRALSKRSNYKPIFIMFEIVDTN